MKTPDKILVELLGMPSTADAIAARVRVPMLVALAMLRRHAKDGLVTSATADLTVWSLTPAGKALAGPLQTERRLQPASSI